MCFEHIKLSYHQDDTLLFLQWLFPPLTARGYAFLYSFSMHTCTFSTCVMQVSKNSVLNSMCVTRLKSVICKFKYKQWAVFTVNCRYYFLTKQEGRFRECLLVNHTCPVTPLNSSWQNEAICVRLIFSNFFISHVPLHRLCIHCVATFHPSPLKFLCFFLLMPLPKGILFNLSGIQG